MRKQLIASLILAPFIIGASSQDILNKYEAHETKLYKQQQDYNTNKNIDNLTSLASQDIESAIALHEKNKEILHIELNTSLDKLEYLVNANSSFESILKEESRYEQIRMEIESIDESLSDLYYSLSSLSDYENMKSDVSFDEIEETKRILSKLKKDYEFAKSLESLGDTTKVRSPISSGVFKINSPFGRRGNPTGSGREYHSGLDIDANKGDKNLALFNGVVIESSYSSVYGNYVIIQHKDGLQTLYGHAERNLVKVGDKVHQYQPIQLSGTTGRSTGVHLHLAVIENGKHVDPMKYFR